MRPIAAVGLSGFVALALACGGLPQGKAPRHDMPLRTYLATHPAEPVVMTLECQLGKAPTWENTGVLGAMYTDLYRIEATDWVDGGSVSTTLWCRRNKPIGDSVFGILKDGRMHAITLTVQIHNHQHGSRNIEIIAVH